MDFADAAQLTPAQRKLWLRANGRLGLYPAGLAVLDAIAAIAFAGGLALMLAPMARGPSALLPGAALALTGALFRGLLARLSAGAGATSAAKVKGNLREKAVRAALAAKAGARRPLGEVMATTVDAVEALDGYFARFAPTQTAAAVSPLLVALAMAFASPMAAGIVLVTFAPFILAMALAGGAAERQARDRFEAVRRLSGLFADRIRALPLVLAFQAEATTTQALSASSEFLAARTLDVLRVAFLSSGVLEFFAALSVALVAVYCGFNLLHLLPFPTPEHLDLRRAVFVLALAPEAYLPMRRLAAAYHDRQGADAAAAILAPTILELQSGSRRRLLSPPEIRFYDVVVMYPDDVRAALDRFSLHLMPGQSVALLGPTGSGKSTVLHLLLGLIVPTEGEITVDDLPLQQGGAPMAAWAGQAPMVVPGSLQDNIALVWPQASLGQVVSAASRVGLLGTPGGLERRIDERGGGLSGGERRRLGLARALLSAAPLLLLDEPTSNLDRASETALLPIIAEVMSGRTSLIATHSERVAALADRVIRLRT